MKWRNSLRAWGKNTEKNQSSHERLHLKEDTWRGTKTQMKKLSQGMREEHREELTWGRNSERKEDSKGKLTRTKGQKRAKTQMRKLHKYMRKKHWDEWVLHCPATPLTHDKITSGQTRFIPVLFHYLRKLASVESRVESWPGTVHECGCFLFLYFFIKPLYRENIYS